MPKVLGIGNALVDIMTRLGNDELLKTFNLPKGGMQLVDSELSKLVIDNTGNLEKQMTSGGSAANTIHGLANLGTETGFIGKIGNDEFGEFFLNDMKNKNINPILSYGNNDTGKAIALVSPDAERTFATYLGASIELTANDLSLQMFAGYDYLHIEGYLVQDHDLVKKAVEMAKQNNMTVCLDMASYNVVEANLEFLKTLIKNYVDIVFANEDEARSFTGSEPEEALHKIAEDCDIAVVKTGEKGSLIKQAGNVYTVDTINVNCIDTTGAGDLYAAGFIYGLIKGYPVDRCGRIGTVLAGKVIEVTGAKMDTNTWTKIRELIS